MSDTPENKKPLTDADKQYQEMLLAGLESMKTAAQEMNDFVAARRRKVPEHYFVNVLLPLIRSHVRGESNENIGLWFNVADGMHNQMDIVDESGNILFVAPAAFNNIPDRSTRPEPGDRTPTIHQLVERQGDMLDNGDIRGSMDIDRRIVELCAPRPEDAEKTENLVLLVKLYDRYNLPLTEVLGEKADEISEILRQQSSNSSEKGSNDDDASGEPTLIY